MTVEATAVAVRPLVGWPHQAELGRTYLITVDLRLAEGNAWPYEHEEYPVYCFLASEPACSIRPLGPSAVVLHRYGGTYGPAKFLLRGLELTSDAGLHLHLANRWGAPILGLALPMQIVGTSERDEPEATLQVKRELQSDSTLPGPPSDRREPGFHGNKAFIIRIEEPPISDPTSLLVRGLETANAGSDEIERSVGQIPWPLPPIQVNGRYMEPMSALRQLDRKGRNSQLTAKHVGLYLWHLLAATPVGEWWERAVDATPPAETRTILDIRPANLWQLPWELLYHEPSERWLFLSLEKPWYRGIGAGTDAESILVPVRMLVVASDLADQLVSDTVDAIYFALRGVPARWDVAILRKPSLEEIRQTLDVLRPHVLHLIAETTVAEGSTFISFDPEWQAPASALFDGSSPPCLLVLDTRAAGSNQVNVQETIADFLRWGCAAVVAVPDDLPSAASRTFHTTFYEGVANGEAVDIAVTRGRRAVQAAMRSSWAWATPSLHLRARPDRVLPVVTEADADDLEQPYRAAFEPVRTFVDRVGERQDLLRQVTEDVDVLRGRLTVVEGQPDVGKSAVVRSVLLTCYLRGQRVVYVDLGIPMRDQSWLDMLRYMRNEISAWLPQDAAEPIRRFNHELNYLLEQREFPPYDPMMAREDEGKAFAGPQEDDQSWAPRIFESFLRMLTTIAATQPLLIALDHLEVVPRYDFVQFVQPGLVEPAAQGNIQNVHIILVDNGERIPVWMTPVTRIEIRGFRTDALPKLVRESFARRGRTLELDLWMPILDRMFDSKSEFTGSELQQLLTFLDKIR